MNLFSPLFSPQSNPIVLIRVEIKSGHCPACCCWYKDLNEVFAVLCDQVPTHHCSLLSYRIPLTFEQMLIMSSLVYLFTI